RSCAIPPFLRRALDDKYGMPAAERIKQARDRVAKQTPSRIAGDGRGGGLRTSVSLVDFDPQAQRKVCAAALFPHSNAPLAEQSGDPAAVLDALLADRANRRQRVPRALEHAQYEFEIVANFAAYRDLHRHRMLTQDRQLLGTALGYAVPPGLGELGMESRFMSALEAAAEVHGRLEKEVGATLAQYVVPLAFHVRWYFRANLREIYHLCELRTTPQGHPDYRWVAQEMFRLIAELHPRLG